MSSYIYGVMNMSTNAMVTN